MAPPGRFRPRRRHPKPPISFRWPYRYKAPRVSSGPIAEVRARTTAAACLSSAAAPDAKPARIPLTSISSSYGA